MNAMPSSVLTIPQFCERFDLSLSTYYRLRRNGHGPRELRVGRRVIIPVTAADDWAETLTTLNS